MKINLLKVGLALIVMLGIGATAKAQQIDGAAGIAKIEDSGKSQTLNGTIRVIDNKGTKKYLQVQNGLTLLTNDTPDGGIVSTWQLGGELANNTYIDASGNTFSLDGLKLVASTDAAATAATDLSIGSNAVTVSGTGTAATETGWTILVRDEATGEIRKILATDLVKAGQLEAPALADSTAPTIADASIPSDNNKVFVYRNGVKLRAGVDYDAETTQGTVTLNTGAAAPNDWDIYNGDIFEVHWIN